MHEESKMRFVLLLALVFSLSAFIISLAAFYRSSNDEKIRQQELETVILRLEDEVETQKDPADIPKVLEEFLNELRVHNYKV